MLQRDVRRRFLRSLKIAALLKKDLPENADLPVDFLGFTIGPEFVVGYGSSTWRDAVAFGFLIVVLLFKPEGLFGRVTAEKV